MDFHIFKRWRLEASQYAPQAVVGPPLSHSQRQARRAAALAGAPTVMST